MAAGTVYYAGKSVTPSDTALIVGPVNGLYVGGAGNLNVVMNEDGETPTLFTAIPAGTLLPISVKRVLSTSTTATAIVALR